MKRGFEENVPRVRPRVRLGRAIDDALAEAEALARDEATQPPPAEAAEVAPEEPVADPVRMQFASPVGSAAPLVESSAAPVESSAPLVQPAAAPTASVAASMESPAAPVESSAAPESLAVAVESAVARQNGAAVANLPEVAPPIPTRDVPRTRAEPLPIQRPAPAPVESPRSFPSSVSALPVAAPAPVAPFPVPAQQRPRRAGAADQVARLAKELTADLSHAADVNARLRADLDSALTALRNAAEESRQDGIERERLAAESQSRAEAARRLEEELQLVEAERDGALGQVARLTRELRDERLRAGSAAEDVRKARAEAAQAQEEARRLSAELGARTAELDQANAGIESMRREHDSLAAALLAARSEADEAARSRTALEEIHRALDEARVRVAKIR